MPTTKDYLVAPFQVDDEEISAQLPPAPVCYVRDRFIA
jgi:hypothetical protein